MDLRIDGRGRPKASGAFPDTTVFRHNTKHKVIIDSAMDEYGLGKSEMLRHIIEEWNMLRYKGDD